MHKQRFCHHHQRQSLAIAGASNIFAEVANLQQKRYARRRHQPLRRWLFPPYPSAPSAPPPLFVVNLAQRFAARRSVAMQTHVFLSVSAESRVGWHATVGQKTLPAFGMQKISATDVS